MGNWGMGNWGIARRRSTQTGMEYGAKCVIVTTGTFLKGLIHIGETQFSAGRAGEFAAEKLSGSLRGLGFELGRLKTGTTARIDKRTIDLSKCERQESEPVGPFSFMAESGTWRVESAGRASALPSLLFPIPYSLLPCPAG